MLELRRASAEVARCLARPEALDRLPAIPGAFACRVAPDELLLVALDGSGIAEEAAGQLARADAGGLTVDETAGWAVWTLAGNDREEAFARLSAVRLPGPPAFAQGAVGGVPAKIVVVEDEVHVVVASSLAHQIRERIAAACGDLLPEPC